MPERSYRRSVLLAIVSIATLGLVIALGIHQLSSPDSRSEVTPSATQARNIAVWIDGRKQMVATSAVTVGAVVAQLGLPADSFVSVDPSLALRAGAELTIRTPRVVTIKAAGQSTTMSSTAATVQQLFVDAGYPVSPSDLLSAPRTAPVSPNHTYTLTRVERVVDTVSRTLPARTTWTTRASLGAGVSRVVTNGRDGFRSRRITRTYEDGRRVARKVGRLQVVQPVTWVIAVGEQATDTSDWTPATGKVRGREPNFAALAKCESGGRPLAVSATGKYRGLYQFDLNTWHGIGGVGDPIDATPQEQTYRARLLYLDRGRAPWPYCGRFL